MDSFTHIVLGAACGELVAGRKIGNRAMLWGAIGCTIPDFDVFAGFFTDELSSTAFHRGILHSFFFIALSPWLLAWLVKRFYANGTYQRPGYKAAAMAGWSLFYLGIALGINYIPVALGGSFHWYLLVPTVALGIWLGWSLWRNYWSANLEAVELPYRTWVLLLFSSMLIHPLLDCCTNWGTQIWQPFSDLRVQWCTISVADPLCTLPFALCILVASLLARTNRRRAWWNAAGLVWFCGYLCVYAVWHKVTVNHAFEQLLQAKNIRYQRYYTNPTILNNIVWSGLAEGDTAYYFSLYGFNDQEPGFSGISVIPKNHALLDGIPDDDRAKHFLLWFSDGYYNVLPYHGDTLQVNDLRFGLQGDSLRGNNYVYPFLLYKNQKGAWDLHQNNRSKESVESSSEAMGGLWRRVKGRD